MTHVSAAAGMHFLFLALLCQTSHAFSPTKNALTRGARTQNVVAVPTIASAGNLASVRDSPQTRYRSLFRLDVMPLDDENEDTSPDEETSPLDKVDEDNAVEKAIDELAEETPKSFWASVKSAMKGKKEDEGLTFRQKLAKMGLSCALSYGWVSNMSYSVTVSMAWYIFSKQTGLSPLAPGQWKPFLAVYAGFYVFNNFVRPIRFALSVGVSRYFDNAVKFIERKTKVSRGVAIGILVFLANFLGTLAAMSFGILIASTAAGVPVFVPKA